MIDMHCHILFDIDDSIKTREDSIAMLHMAHQDGIKAICATSHVHYKFPNTKVQIQERCDCLKQYIKESGLPIKLIEASELFLSHDTERFLYGASFVPYENTRYVLVEFPWKPADGDCNVDDLLMNLIEKGYTPVIAHPERYQQVYDDFSLVYKWRAMGCLLQINRTSILGYDKLPYAKELSLRMMDEDIVDIIASDSHGPYGKRPVILSDVYSYVCEHYGEDRAKHCMEDVPRNLLHI